MHNFISYADLQDFVCQDKSPSYVVIDELLQTSEVIERLGFSVLL